MADKPFFDFKKPFDSVSKECIWSLLLSRGIPEKLITITSPTYNGEICPVGYQDKTAGEIKFQSEDRLCSILSPTPFLRVISDAVATLTEWTNSSGFGQRGLD